MKLTLDTRSHVESENENMASNARFTVMRSDKNAAKHLWIGEISSLLTTYIYFSRQFKR